VIPGTDEPSPLRQHISEEIRPIRADFDALEGKGKNTPPLSNGNLDWLPVGDKGRKVPEFSLGPSGKPTPTRAAGAQGKRGQKHPLPLPKVTIWRSVRTTERPAAPERSANGMKEGE